MTERLESILSALSYYMNRRDEYDEHVRYWFNALERELNAHPRADKAKITKITEARKRNKTRKHNEDT